MNALALRIHGTAVRVESDNAYALDALRRDFEYFAAEAPIPQLTFVLHLHRPADAERGERFVFRGRGFAVFSRERERLIRYDDGAFAAFDYAAGRGRILCPEPHRLHELAYLAILSRVGEDLDRRGLHRIHALGFEWRGEGGLLLLPSGGGKSTLALELLGATQAGLLSDDSPLVDADGVARAFPLRLGFRPDADLSRVPTSLRRPLHRLRHGPKVAVDLPFFRDRIRAQAPVRWLILGRPGAGLPRIRPASYAAAAAALAQNLVIGHGTAQMAEYMLRPTPSGLLGLARIASARARAARTLLRSATLWNFSLGQDPVQSARTLAEFLSR